MSRRKYQPGLPIVSVNDLNDRIRRHEYFYPPWSPFRAIHHTWIRNTSYWMVTQWLALGLLRCAVPVWRKPVALLEYKPLGPTDNPMLDVMEANVPQITKPRPSSFTMLFSGGAAGFNFDEHFRQISTEHQWRDAMVRQYSFAVPTEAALQKILDASRGRIVEIGAGTGYWSALLAARGADVVAYDDRSWDGLTAFQHFPVHDGTWRAARSHPDRALFLCWPPMTSMAWAAIRTWHKAGGRTVIYIGEGEDGCTADDRFHHYLDEYSFNWKSHSIPQWNGIHDRVLIHHLREHPARAKAQQRRVAR